EYSMSMGVLPGWMRPIDVKHLAGIACGVARRLGQPTDRVDLFEQAAGGRTTGGADGEGGADGGALTLLIAGSDTTRTGTEDELVANAEQVKRLPYLDACINEGLRIHSTSALGLPRVGRDAMQRAFNPFSVGPKWGATSRLELQIIVASIMRRYHFVLERPEQECLQTRDGFLRKPLRCDVGISGAMPEGWGGYAIERLVVFAI
ncbi:hypothetical protein B0H14DRAFT_2875578, partial [Mycena olivaceomarginata]